MGGEVEISTGGIRHSGDGVLCTLRLPVRVVQLLAESVRSREYTHARSHTQMHTQYTHTYMHKYKHTIQTCKRAHMHAHILT